MLTTANELGYKEMKAAITQNVTCAISTAAFTGLYSAILFAGAQLVTVLV